MFITGVSAFFALLVFSPYVIGVLRQPPGVTFAGAVHYPLDYYYYLSYMVQGKLRWFTSFNINTSDTTSIFYHWFYVLAGRIFTMFHISNILGYQLLVLGLTILLLFLSYRLICEILPSRGERTIAYILFLASNAWPSYWSWYNYGEPFIRFSSIPHHLLAQNAVLTSLFLLVRFPRARYALFFLCGFIIASTQTPLVIVVLLTYGIFWKKTLPAIMLFASGAIPYIAYLHGLFQNPPYSTIIAWEASRQVHMSVLEFFQVNGPVVLLGVIGLPLFLSAKTRVRQMIVVFTLISWGLFLSPVPALIGILNARFLSVVPTLAMACSTAVLIEAVTKRFAVRLAIMLLLLAVTLPATVQQVIARSTFDPTNGYYYLPNTVLDAYREVGNRIKPDETCLVVWPFHVSFTGLTGRRAFTVNTYATINYQAKEQHVTAFFSDQTPLSQKTRILKDNGISCVFTYSFTKNLPPALVPIYTNSYITVYKVL